MSTENKFEILSEDSKQEIFAEDITNLLQEKSILENKLLPLETNVNIWFNECKQKFDEKKSEIEEIKNNIEALKRQTNFYALCTEQNDLTNQNKNYEDEIKQRDREEMILYERYELRKQKSKDKFYIAEVKEPYDKLHNELEFKRTTIADNTKRLEQILQILVPIQEQLLILEKTMIKKTKIYENGQLLFDKHAKHNFKCIENIKTKINCIQQTLNWIPKYIEYANEHNISYKPSIYNMFRECNKHHQHTILINSEYELLCGHYLYTQYCKKDPEKQKRKEFCEGCGYIAVFEWEFQDFDEICEDPTKFNIKNNWAYGKRELYSTRTYR